MKTGKQMLSVLLSVLLLLGTVAFVLPAAAEETPAYDVGDVIEYGTYPQSLVTDAALLAVLPTLPGTWNTYEYEGTATNSEGYTYPVAFTGMQYIDVVYRNVKYRGVKIDDYRPFTVPQGQSEGSTQEQNGYTVGTYWFRYDPLRWRVLDPETGLVMSDTIIDSQPFTQYMDPNAAYYYSSMGEYGLHYGYLQNGSVSGVFASITDWLNEDFLSVAFSPAQQENILSDTQVNDYWLIGNGTVSQDGNGYHKYDATATEGKIFLPAWDEVSDAAAGFNADGNAADAARTLGGSDYAKAQGLEVFGDGETARWLLRTMSRYFNARCASQIDETGMGIAHPRTDDRYSRYGICPMMRMEVIVSEGTGESLLHTGDNFYFGAYPQSRVTDADTIAALNARLPYAQQHPLTMYTYSWNYVADKYIDYADMIVGTQKYRAKIRYMDIVTPPTGNATVDEYTDYDYHYTDGDREKYVSYYLFEPLLWRLLDPETGLSMCEGIVESLVYQNVHIRIPDPSDPDEQYWYWDAWGNEEETRYATDYTISNIRPFLNNDFYNTAFTPAQQEKIVTTDLDNTSMMTLAGTTGYEQYDWDSCSDKVFLLSSAEVMNPDYGFSPDAMEKDDARVLLGNDYAGYTNPKSYNNLWILRNAADMYPGRRPNSCSYYGQVSNTGSWANELQPICPAICLTEVDNDLSAATVECTDHEPTVVTTTPATCTQPGVGQEVCALCGAVLNEAVTIPALGHDLVQHEGQAATCGAGGWAAYETCSRCDYTTYRAIGPTGAHNWTWIVDTPATCGTAGEKHEACDGCGATRSEGTTIPATGEHSWSWTIDAEPTCGTAGEKHEVCDGCGATRSEGTTIPATGTHNWKWVVDTEATCGTAGVKHEECSSCHITRSENTVIDPTGVHVYSAATVKEAALKLAAACAQNAVYYYSCKDCGAVEHNDSHTFEAEGTALRHVDSDWIIDSNATCKVEGSKHIECTVCHKVLETQTIEKLPHTPKTVPGKAATCKETGLTDGVVCSVCGDVIQAQTVIGKTAHKWNGGAVTTQPTCTAAGVKTYICTVCGDTKTEPVAALGHAWGGWTTVKEPTCTETGVQQRVCGRDGSHKETRTLEKKSHTDNGSGYCKDCGADLRGGQRCKYCGETHGGAFGWLIKFFHSILAAFGLKK